MSLTVVGSIAFDSVKTPHGERDRMLGGAAVHFALAASFFDEVRVVGPVGDDFGDEHVRVLTERGIVVDDIEHVPGGRTFFWSGVYGEDLNDRETLETELGVFETFEPKLSEAARDCDVLFLANIVPDVQRQVHAQCEQARFVAMDSMNLWIDIARDSLVETISGVDAVILNDAELRQLTGAPTVLEAADAVREMGPDYVIAKYGEYGCALYSEEGVSALPAYPLQTVQDPTGAGDSFAGGLMGYVAATPGQKPTHADLVAAMAYGTAIASHNVEEFGTDRVRRLSADEIAARVEELRRMTAFEPGDVALRA
jgi:sugar/nucleoside kinase (ribokinase family)